MKKREGEWLVFRTSEGKKRIKPWDANFGYFWYNDAEIFHDTEHDLELKAEKLAAQGVNIVITFSCSHFRWSFLRYHDLLTEALAKVVRACHKHGILVVEHHSSELWHAIANDESRAFLENVLKTRGSSIASWPGLIEDAVGDPIVIDNIPRSRMLQVDGETGGVTLNCYKGYSMCYNNPDYRRAYFQYLERVYATGVDGIMTDDVQWLGAKAQENACACPHCREKFTRETGLTLPPSGEAWTRWRQDGARNSLCLAWRNFRLRSIEAFHQAVMERYESLGLSLLRPNYCSSALNGNSSAYCLETLPDLDWVFQESCFSSLIRYSWPRWSVEQAHRYAVSRRRQIPSMDTFYPDRPDTTIFCWSLAMSWGAKYLATAEGAGENPTEKRLRAFERQHARLWQGAEKISPFAVYDARACREFYGDYNARTGRWTAFILEACELNNVPYDLIQSEDLERLASYSIIFLPEVAALSRNERLALRAFAENGGTLVWGGRTGTLDERGAPLAPETLAGDLGVADFAIALDEAMEITECPLGRGRVIVVPFQQLNGEAIDDYWVNRFEPGGATRRVAIKPVGPTRRQAFRVTADFIRRALPENVRFDADNLPEDVLISTLMTADKRSLVVHVRNVGGTINPDHPDGGSHEDTIPFPAMPNWTIQIVVPTPSVAWRDKSPRAVAYDPECEEAMALKCAKTANGMIRIYFSLASLRAYKLIELAFE